MSSMRWATLSLEVQQPRKRRHRRDTTGHWKILPVLIPVKVTTRARQGEDLMETFGVMEETLAVSLAYSFVNIVVCVSRLSRVCACVRL
jgi:hypothetical protein